LALRWGAAGTVAAGTALGCMDLKIVLAQINADSDKLFHGWSPSLWRSGGHVEAGVAVGRVIADRPPHRSRRAVLPHRAPTSDE
jgi:hypothetical protein